MLTFEFKARQRDGRELKGQVAAESRLAALDQLSQKGVFPIRLEESVNRGTLGRVRWLSESVSRKALSLWTRQLADLLDSGVPLLRALSLVQEQTESPLLARVTGEMSENVRGGQAFSDALKSYPAIFPTLAIRLIYAGEAGGTLSLTLGRLADFFEQDEDFKARVQAALAYPLLIAGVGIGTVLFLLAFAVPRLAAMFEDMGQAMPFMTRILSDLGGFLMNYGGWALLALLIATAAAAQGAARQKLVTAWRVTSLRLPIWGIVMRKSLMARFARTLATCLTGGVPIVEALRVASGVLDHPALGRQILEVAGQVEQGQSLSQSLRSVPEIPVFVRQMIAVGEEGNTLEKSLHKVAATYERETDRAMKLATSLLEPCMILGVGAIVGIIVVAMLLPIFQVSSFMK